MKYMGSKRKIIKDILPFILKNKKENQYYVEPFVGGCNSIECVYSKFRIGADINYYLIELWKKVSEGWIPPLDLTEEEYNKIKNNKDNYDPWLVGYVGFALSYGGKFFGGWSRNKNGRNYVKEAYNSALKQFPKLKNIEFIHSSYEDLIIPEKSIIYCDPPYKGTTKYKEDINHLCFWEWCREQYLNGHEIYISEYSAPDDFICIWKKQDIKFLVRKLSIEKLFTYKG